MSFLSEVAEKGLEGLREAAPLLGGIGSGYVPTPFHVIAGLIVAAEAAEGVCKQAGGGKVDKLSFVVEQAKEVLLNSPLFRDKQIQDGGNFDAGVTQLVQGIVRVLQSIGTPAPHPASPAAQKPNAPAQQH